MMLKVIKDLIVSSSSPIAFKVEWHSSRFDKMYLSKENEWKKKMNEMYLSKGNELKRMKCDGIK